MVKKAVPLFSLILLLAACATTDHSTAEYFSVDEILDAWLEGVYDQDVDRQMSAYWPEATGFFISDEGEAELFGRDEIRAYFDAFYGEWDIGDYVLPEFRLYEENEDNVYIAYLYHDSIGLDEQLVITRRDDIWGIERHHIVPFRATPVSSPLNEPADEDGNGELDTHRLLIHEHIVESPLDEIFDFNANGFVDEPEVFMAREFYFGVGLGVLFETEPEYAFEITDLNRDGNVEDFEVMRLLEHLMTYHYENEADIPQDDILFAYLDLNGDGFLDIEEYGMPFWHLSATVSRQPLPGNPMVALEDARQEWRHDEGTRSQPESAPAVAGRTLEKLQGKRVAVVSIDTVTDKITEETRRGLILFVENGFVNTGQVIVVDRNSIDKIIEENRFQSAGLTDEDTAVQIGKLAGAEIIVTGTVSSVGSNFYLQLRLIDVETAEVVASSLGEAKIENEFLNMSTIAVQRLF